MYITYDEYAAMGGAAEAAAFERLEARARGILDALTHSRLRAEAGAAGLRPAARLAMAEMIDLLNNASAAPCGVSRRENDGVSESYFSGDQARRALIARLRDAAAAHLAGEVDARGVPLLYAGEAMA